MEDVLRMLQQQITVAWDKLQEIINVPKRQRRLIMIIVCVALLLDNMLYMVIVSARVRSSKNGCRQRPMIRCPSFLTTCRVSEHGQLRRTTSRKPPERMTSR